MILASEECSSRDPDSVRSAPVCGPYLVWAILHSSIARLVGPRFSLTGQASCSCQNLLGHRASVGTDACSSISKRLPFMQFWRSDCNQAGRFPTWAHRFSNLAILESSKGLHLNCNPVDLGVNLIEYVDCKKAFGFAINSIIFKISTTGSPLNWPMHRQCN